VIIVICALASKGDRRGESIWDQPLDARWPDRGKQSLSLARRNQYGIYMQRNCGAHDCCHQETFFISLTLWESIVDLVTMPVLCARRKTALGFSSGTTETGSDHCLPQTNGPGRHTPKRVRSSCASQLPCRLLHGIRTDQSFVKWLEGLEVIHRFFVLAGGPRTSLKGSVHNNIPWER
jgi:hypothetical protein